MPRLLAVLVIGALMVSACGQPAVPASPASQAATPTPAAISPTAKPGVAATTAPSPTSPALSPTTPAATPAALPATPTAAPPTPTLAPPTPTRPAPTATSQPAAPVATPTPLPPTATPTPPPASASPTETPPPAPPPPSASEVQVNIQGFAFSPEAATVPSGTAVRWTNRDVDPHTVSSAKGAFESGNLNQGQSFTFRLTQPGTYDYICAYHPDMTGVITVR